MAGSGREGQRSPRGAGVAAQRRKARHYGLQAIYRWQFNGGSAAEIEAEFRTEFDMGHTDLDYFRAILEGVIYHQPDIDAAYEHLLDRKLDDLTPVELALLRMSIFEMKERVDVPYRVVISEAVELARKFGATDSYKYVNGILDRAATQLRAPEAGAR